MFRKHARLILSSSIILVASVAAIAATDITKLEDEGFKALDASDWPLAIEKFSQINEKLPNQPTIELNLGFALMKIGKVEEAISHFLHATELKPDYDLAWMNLARCYQLTDQIEKNIDALQHLVAVTKNEKEKEHAQATLTLLREALKNRVVDESKTDYLQSILAHSRDRWSPDKQPLKVYIADGTGIPNYKPEYFEFARQAFIDWQEASGGRLKFEFVNTEKDAPMELHWLADPKQLENPAEAGECKTVVDGQGTGLKEAHIAIGLFGPDIKPEAIRATCLHEVGHACGIDGHSRDPGDIMYITTAGSVTPINSLSARDKETIYKFYNNDIGDSWLVLNKAGMDATTKQDFKAAFEYFAKAMKLTDHPMVRSNCAAAHFNFAGFSLNKGDMKTAEDQFKIALEMQEKLHDPNYGIVIDGYARFLRMQKRDAEAAGIEKLRNK